MTAACNAAVFYILRAFFFGSALTSLSKEAAVFLRIMVCDAELLDTRVWIIVSLIDYFQFPSHDSNASSTTSTWRLLQMQLLP